MARPIWQNRVLRALLLPFGVLYGVGARLRRSLYRSGMRASHDLGVPTISVGNLTVGGTGKSPFIRTVIDLLPPLSGPVIVLGRGYGEAIDRDGRRLNDEGHELARARPEAVIVQGADRVAAVREAMNRVTPAVILLDDGAQHLRIARQLDILLVDAASLLGSTFCLPAGPWRESLDTISTCDVAVITRADRVSEDDLGRVRRRVEQFIIPDRVMTAVHRPGGLRNENGEMAPIEELCGARVGLISAIATPDDFARAVDELGATIVFDERFDDHHVFTRTELDRLAVRATEADFIVTTGKDSPKIDIPHRILEIDVDLGVDSPRLAAILGETMDG